jgi:hypothetical protein
MSKQAYVLPIEKCRGFGCCFEEYSKDKKKMINCGEQPIASVGGKLICVNHISDVLAYSPALNMYGLPVEGQKIGDRIDFKEDMLKLCKEEAKLREGKK